MSESDISAGQDDSGETAKDVEQFLLRHDPIAAFLKEGLGKRPRDIGPSDAERMEAFAKNRWKELISEMEDSKEQYGDYFIKVGELTEKKIQEL